MFIARRSSWPKVVVFVVLALASQGCRKAEPKPQGPPTAAADALLAAGKPIEAIAAYRALPASDASARGLGLSFSLIRRWPEANAALTPYVKAHPEDTVARMAWVTSLVGIGDLTAGRTEAAALAKAAPQDLPIQLLAAALADDDASRRAALDRLAAWKRDPADPKSEPFELLTVRAWLARALGNADVAQAAATAAENAPLRNAGEAMALAETYQRLGQPQMTERLLLKITEDAAALPAALRAASEISLEMNKPERVSGLLARIPKEQVIGPVDGLISARAKLALGDADAAIAELSALITTLERDKRPLLTSRARLWLSRAYAAKGDADKAKEALLGIDDPGLFFERNLALAENELKAGNPQAAIDALKPVIEKDKEAVAPQLMLASALMKAGKPEEAQKGLSELASARPDDPRIPYTLATTLEATGDRAGAEREYKRALEIAPGSLAPLRHLMDLLDAQKRGSEAEQVLREQIARAPRIAALRQMLGLRLEQRGDVASAEEAFKAGMQVDGGSESSWIALADHYMRTKRPARALELLDHVLQGSPQSSDALVRSGSALRALGQKQEAIARYERALGLRPHDIGIQNNLALLLADQAATRDRALELAQAADKALPNTPQILDTLGYVLMRRGELDQAIPLLRRSAAALPELPEVQHHLGTALLLKGEQAAGRKLIEQARQRDPSLAGPDQALAAARE